MPNIPGPLDNQDSCSAALRLPAAAEARRSGSSRQGCASDGVQVPIPSIARFRRLAYPGHGEGTNHERRGWKSHGCHAVDCRIGRSALGGEHTCGPEHPDLTAASKRAPYCKRCTGFAKRRPGPNAGKADVGEEETGRGTPQAAGVGGQAHRERCAETTSGRSCSPQGLTAPCLDLLSEGSPEAAGGWRTGA